MFLIITIVVLTMLVCVSDRLTQQLVMELVGELLTTILNPCNFLQGGVIISHDMHWFNMFDT